MSTLTVPNEPRTAPPIAEGEVAEICPKCSGTGFYCMGTENGRPFSFTGFDCHPCGGSGWIVSTEEARGRAQARRARAEAKAEEEREEAVLKHAMEVSEIHEIIATLLPRATAVYPELKEESEDQRAVGEFLLRARQFEAGAAWVGQYGIHPGWMRETMLPILLKWEKILESRKADADTSDFVGTPGQAIITEATVTFTKSFESAYGTRFLTLLKDDKGNILKYWNVFNIIDPIATEAQGQPVQRSAGKGDKIKFKATVKGHEIYKGVRGTVLQRARKAELIHAAPAQ